MPADCKRIYGPDNVLAPIFFQKIEQPESLVDESNLRLDGRKLDEVRPSLLKFGISSEAAGSAYYECGSTKVIASVYGPRDVIRKSEFSHKSQLYCEFKYTPYSCKVRQSHVPSHDEKSISVQLQQALESVVLMHKFPKARIEIFIQVLEDDGGAIGCALTCAGAALCNAGVEMYDIVVGCTMLHHSSHTFIDPDSKEEAFQSASLNHGKIVMGMMPIYNQVVMLQQEGELGIEVLAQCIKNLMGSCQKLVSMVRHFLQKSAEEKEREAGRNHEIGDAK